MQGNIMTFTKKHYEYLSDTIINDLAGLSDAAD